MSGDLRAVVRRACRDQTVRDVLLSALDRPDVTARLTSSGQLRVNGPAGSVTVTLAPNRKVDPNLARRTRGQLRRIGVMVER